MIFLLGKIKEARFKSEITQKELAKLCNLSQSYLSLIENGYKRPHLNTLEKIAKGLDICIFELIDFCSECNISNCENKSSK